MLTVHFTSRVHSASSGAHGFLNSTSSTVIHDLIAEFSARIPHLPSEVIVEAWTAVNVPRVILPTPVRLGRGSASSGAGHAQDMTAITVRLYKARTYYEHGRYVLLDQTTDRENIQPSTGSVGSGPEQMDEIASSTCMR